MPRFLITKVTYDDSQEEDHACNPTKKPIIKIIGKVSKEKETLPIM